MKNIYSKIYPKKLLHLIIRPSDFTKKITEITKKNQSLQCIAIKMGKGEKIQSHKHIKKNHKNLIYMRTQESWCVIKGSIKGYFYDIDNKLIYSTTLKTGDASFTFQGGHSFKALTFNTIIYEYKKGPYKIKFNDIVYF
jgi:hypothetical protein